MNVATLRAHARDAAGVVLVTGGAGGIGAPCVRLLADALPTHVIALFGRDRERLADAAHALGPRVVPLLLHLADTAATVSLAAELAAAADAGQLPPLHHLVCIAGIQSPAGALRRARDGIEETYAVNHLAHFALCTTLAAAMPRDARVVLVSSGTHDPGTIEGRFNRPDLRAPSALLARESALKHVSAIRRYATSKLYNVLTAYELARRASAHGRRLDVFAFDPGAVPGTGLLRDMPAALRVALTWRPLLSLAGVRTCTPQDAGADLAHVVLDPALTGTGSAYFAGTRRTRSSAYSYDPAAASALWQASVDALRAYGAVDPFAAHASASRHVAPS